MFTLNFFNYTLKYYDQFCVILINILLVSKHLSVGCYRTHHASRLWSELGKKKPYMYRYRYMYKRYIFYIYCKYIVWLFLYFECVPQIDHKCSRKNKTHRDSFLVVVDLDHKRAAMSDKQLCLMENFVCCSLSFIFRQKRKFTKVKYLDIVGLDVFYFLLITLKLKSVSLFLISRFSNQT